MRGIRFLLAAAIVALAGCTDGGPARYMVTGKVTYQGQPEVVLKAGGYAYGPAKRPHEGSCASDEACVLFIAFEGPVDAVAGLPPEPAH